MSHSIIEIRNEFDRLADVSNERWEQSKYFYNQILEHVPQNGRVLEIGCGTGTLTRMIAAKAKEVIALDIAPQMLSIAKTRSSNFQNISYIEDNFLTRTFSEEGFDFIVSIATLHHLPFEDALMRMRDLLKANGKIFILDLYKNIGIANFFLNGANLFISSGLNLINNKRLRSPKHVRDAWLEHEKFDEYMTVEEVKERTAKILPDAEIKKCLLWRYSLIWEKQNRKI